MAIWYVIGAFALLWFVIGFGISIHQLKTKRGVGSWACPIWGCTYGVKIGSCPNCGKEFEPV